MPWQTMAGNSQIILPKANNSDSHNALSTATIFFADIVKERLQNMIPLKNTTSFCTLMVTKKSLPTRKLRHIRK